MKKDMYYHVISVLLFGLVVVMSSCDSELSDYYNLKEQIQKENGILVNAIHQEVTDSMNSWVKDSLLYVNSTFFTGRWNINELIILNNQKDKFVSTLNHSSVNRKHKQADNSIMLYGVMIKNKWYYFKGATYVLPRGTWQKEFYDPMTSEELDYLGYNFFLKHYIKKTWNGKFVPNEEAFEAKITTKVILGKPSFSKEESDSLFIAKWNSKYEEKILPEWIEPTKEKMAASVRPPEPEPEPYTIWEKIFGRKKKIFETEEWKNRHKKKR
jgi:hypothetical protein